MPLQIFRDKLEVFTPEPASVEHFTSSKTMATNIFSLDFVQTISVVKVYSDLKIGSQILKIQINKIYFKNKNIFNINDIQDALKTCLSQFRRILQVSAHCAFPEAWIVQITPCKHSL